jgi:hypothetical protein
MEYGMIIFNRSCFPVVNSFEDNFKKRVDIIEEQQVLKTSGFRRKKTKETEFLWFPEDTSMKQF